MQGIHSPRQQKEKCIILTQPAQLAPGKGILSIQSSKLCFFSRPIQEQEFHD
jgi:hypothetical protein